MDFLWQSIAVGVGATLFMDIWALIQKKLFNIPSLNYALVGRWIVLMKQGRFCHNTIIQAPEQSGEKTTGWVVHYLIGIFFSMLLILLIGKNWLQDPTILPALLTGLVSALAPFLLMQPCFGFGIAASKTPAPWVARRRSLVAHLSFGVGLWFTAWLLALT
ncbi:DUF2938 domain-containing protein [Pantoea agglomerans]|uniref:DUF2938 domain-containing protein n=1 Tax=Enterobacter agglomerans TaxID=549 RepID=UPI0032081F41